MMDQYNKSVTISLTDKCDMNTLSSDQPVSNVGLQDNGNTTDVILDRSRYQIDIGVETIRNFLQSSQYIVLNVSGVRHQIHWSKLEATSTSSRLSSLRRSDDVTSLCDGCYLSSTSEYPEFYFDRPSSIFNSILTYYLTKELHFPKDTCVEAFKKELDYWQISETNLSQCCEEIYWEQKKNLATKSPTKNQTNSQINYGTGCFANFRRKLWEVTENSMVSNLYVHYTLLRKRNF